MSTSKPHVTFTTGGREHTYEEVLGAKVTICGDVLSFQEFLVITDELKCKKMRARRIELLHPYIENGEMLTRAQDTEIKKIERLLALRRAFHSGIRTEETDRLPYHLS